MHLRHYRLLQSAVTPHLGHVLNARLMDDEDILARCNSCVGQANSFVCSYSMLDVGTKNSLFKVYCSSHYVSERWDLTNNSVEDYCIAWRKRLRRLWSLPNNSGQLSTALTFFTIPLFDNIFRHITNFIYTCLHCDSRSIRNVVLQGLVLIHLSVGMQLFALSIMTLALEIYSTSN
jgi:hypothetical protein